MLRPNLRRGGRNGPPAAKAVAPTQAYKVLQSFSFNNAVQDVDAVIQMTDAQAKYHVLAKRVALVVAATPKAVAPVVTPVVVDAPKTAG
jgi:hypothetical protein